MTTRASKWIEELVAEWVNKTEDETQLERWELLIVRRKKALRSMRVLDLGAILHGLKSCQRNDKLYAELPIGDLGGFECFFMQYQPRKRRVWTARERGAPVSKWKHMSLNEALRIQLARTDLATRMRSPKEGA